MSFSIIIIYVHETIYTNTVEYIRYLSELEKLLSSNSFICKFNLLFTYHVLLQLVYLRGKKISLVDCFKPN